MSAKLVIAWIFTTLVVLLWTYSAWLTFIVHRGEQLGFQGTISSLARLDLSVLAVTAALVVITAGLLFVMIRRKFGEGSRLALSFGALALCFVLVVVIVLVHDL